jgi:transaldolase
MKATEMLRNLGQSLWLDNITRALLTSPRWQRIYNAGGRPQRLLWASTGTKDPQVPTFCTSRPSPRPSR